jgi:hypothetical protein
VSVALPAQHPLKPSGLRVNWFGILYVLGGSQQHFCKLIADLYPADDPKEGDGADGEGDEPGGASTPAEANPGGEDNSMAISVEEAIQLQVLLPSLICFSTS